MHMSERVNLLDLTLPRLTEWFAALGEKFWIAAPT